ncbi:MAG: hypothetical protein PHP22_00145 [Oscillospiraceae bacterium]|nr:hypothetical protein [Oscillospiraceae bacterium]
MNNILSLGFSKPPSGKRSVAAQLSFCFVVTLVILLVVSSMITTTYVAVLEKQRAEAIKAVAVSCGLNLSGTTIEEGMVYPLPIHEFAKRKPYIVNIYLNAGNSFIRVYSSMPEDDTAKPDDSQFILDDVSSEYKKAFDQMTVELSSRTEDKVGYLTAVAPIIGSSGAASGIIEVMMTEEEFHGTVNGFSLSWVFTILSIALSITLVYYQTHKMLVTVFARPDRQLPKIIRYGFAGCETIAFFSAMGCVIPPLIISQFLKNSAFLSELPDYAVQGLIALSVTLYSIGFFGLRSIRVQIFNRLTARVALVVSVVVSFLLLLLNGILSHPISFVLLQLPIAFGLGMLFFFQREYRVYAGRLGHEGFDERTIQSKQFSSQVLGAGVGAVMAGIVYDRFGLLAVLLISGVFLFIVTILSMLFVQHCPSSNEPTLHLSTFIHAISNRRSGSFLISAIVTAGMQLAFFIAFVPNFLGTVGISLATVSFYYMLFSLCCLVMVRLFLFVSRVRMNVVTSLWLSALLQLVGFIAFAILPTAKMLVLSVALFGIAMGLHEFKYPDYYSSLIREEKRSISGIIVERGFAIGVTLSALLFTVILMISSIRVALLVYCLLSAAMLFAYPIMSLVHVSSKAPEEPVGEDPFAEEDGESVDESLEYANSHPGFLRTESTAYPWEDDETIPYYPDEDSPGDPYDDYGGGKWV